MSIFAVSHFVQVTHVWISEKENQDTILLSLVSLLSLLNSQAKPNSQADKYRKLSTNKRWVRTWWISQWKVENARHNQSTQENGSTGTWSWCWCWCWCTVTWSCLPLSHLVQVSSTACLVSHICWSFAFLLFNCNAPWLIRNRCQKKTLRMAKYATALTVKWVLTQRLGLSTPTGMSFIGFPASEE